MSALSPAATVERSRLEQEAHIWLVSPDELSDPEHLQACRKLLSPAEEERYRAILSSRVQHEYLVTRGLVRTTLSRYVPVPPESWVFTTNERGRPGISEPASPGLRFNLSHTGGAVVCLVTGEVDAGVDVEDVTRPIDFLAIASRRFAADEAAEIRHAAADQRATRFYALWTLKEALLKAKGSGMGFPLRSAAFASWEDGTLKVRFEPEIEEQELSWQFALYRLEEERLLAVAIRREETPDRHVVAHRVVPLKDADEQLTLELLAASARRPVTDP